MTETPKLPASAIPPRLVLATLHAASLVLYSVPGPDGTVRLGAGDLLEVSATASWNARAV